MKRQLPWWMTTFTAVAALAFMVLGVMCWLAPQVLFGREGYRTVTRAIVWLLGTTSTGLGWFTLKAVYNKDIGSWLAYLKLILFIVTWVPAIAFFNAGAMETLRYATGINIFVFCSIVLVCILFPLTIICLYLKKYIVEVQDE